MRLLEVEPIIGARLTGAALERAREQLFAPCLDLPLGSWSSDIPLHRSVALLVTSGKLLPGPGWTIIEPAQQAVIGAGFMLAARACPQLVGGLVDALFRSAHAQRELTAVGPLPRVEDRVLTFMSRIMLRWGIVRPDGCVVSLPVTHQTLGQLVGAQRPTVSLACRCSPPREACAGWTGGCGGCPLRAPSSPPPPPSSPRPGSRGDVVRRRVEWPPGP